MPFFSPALPLARKPETLVVPRPASGSARLPESTAYQPLPRHRALTTSPAGLWDAIGAWLGSAGRLLAAGFIVKRRRPATPLAPGKTRDHGARGGLRPAHHDANPSLRERTEMIQLQAENRRLREQLAKLSEEQTQPPPEAAPAETPQDDTSATLASLAL